MKCTLLLFVALASFAAVYVECSGDFKCQAGIPYIENECNGCFCSEGGQLGCTLKACPGERYTELFHCQVGATSKKECNECICVKDLGTICTNKKC